MNRYAFLLSALIFFNFTTAFADTAPTYEGEPWGSTDFSCDDDPCSCLGITTTTSEDLHPNENFKTIDKTSGDVVETLQAICEKQGASVCFANPNSAPKTSKSTYDHCISKLEGPVCNQGGSPEKCCDYPDGNLAACDCNKARVPSCTSPEQCADCLCLAEAGGEPDECKKMQYCVQKKEAKDTGLTACGVAMRTESSNKNAWRYSAARCVCDEGSDSDRGKSSGGTGYNQSFCQCCNGKLDAGQKKALAACKRARESMGDCAGFKYTHYATGTDADDCPCKKSRVKSTKTCGAHVFCDCS